MASLLARSLQLRSPSLARARMMSGHSIEEAIAETDKWKKISFVFLGAAVVPITVYTMVKHFAHHHHWEQIYYPYIGKRNKEMPWTLKGGSKCDLFDYTCAAKEKAAKAAMAD